MKKIFIILCYFLFFFLVSIILAGDYSLNTTIICLIISATSTLITVLVFRNPIHFPFSPFTYIRYLVCLLLSIYSSTFYTLIAFIKRKGKIPTEIAKLPLESKSGFARLLICQAITLTPGTVSVSSKAGSVHVLKIKPESLDGAQKFDTILRGKQ